MHEHQLHQREKKQRGGNDWRERLQRTNIRNRNTETRPTKTKRRNKKNTDEGKDGEEENTGASSFQKPETKKKKKSADKNLY
jgi:hypothetical protein